MGKVMIQSERFTPTSARQILDSNNTGNRTRTAARVKQYAADMKEGRWKETGETIKFGSSGRLLDGQHRLQAVVDSGIAREFLVARGVPDESFAVIDTGKMRTSSDVFTIEGHSQAVSNALSTVARYHLAYRDGNIPNHSLRQATNRLLLDLVEINEDMVPACQFVQSEMKHGTLLGLGALAWVSFETRRIDPTESDIFVLDMIYGTRLEGHDPVTYLRDVLIQNRTARRRAPTEVVLAAVVKAWNRRRKRQRMSGPNTLMRRDWSTFPKFE